MFEYYKKVVFENYVNFSGRARRSEYWYFGLVSTLISIPLNYILPLTVSPGLAIVGTIYSLAVLIPSIAVAVRRMHDLGKSGWYCLIPIYNIVLFCTEGEYGTNQYGPDPKNIFDEINEIGQTE